MNVFLECLQLDEIRLEEKSIGLSMDRTILFVKGPEENRSTEHL